MFDLEDALKPEKFRVADILELEKKYIVPALIHYYKKPALFVRAKGTTIVDSDGKEYIDLFSGICTTLAGHCHPYLIDALKKQLDIVMHTSTLYPTVPMAIYAQKLAGVSPVENGKCFFVNSGSEANEAAILLAKKHTGTNCVISLFDSFHGRTLMAMSITNQGVWRHNIAYASDTIGIPSPYCYRCYFGKKFEKCDLECAYFLERAIKCQTPNRIAALIAEPILGNGGVIVPPNEYFKIIVEYVHKYGGVFISDEVQTGFGRCGEKMWGIQMFDVKPDIITVAKGIGSGFPIGAFVAKSEISDCLKPKDLFSTFGGNPLAMIAGIAVLEIIEKENLMSSARNAGMHFKKGLQELYDKYDIIGDVRGIGLMLGIELVSDRISKQPAIAETQEILNYAFEKGLLLGLGGLNSNVIRIKPPLTINAEEIDKAIKILDEVFQKVIQKK